MCVYIAHKVCSDWRDIALTIRDRVFEEDEEQLIDVHDVKATSSLRFMPSFTLLKLHSCTTSSLVLLVIFPFVY